VRVGRYKGHFVTRPGFGNVPPVFYDPMLLFDLERDPGERFPLNVTEHVDVVADILAKAEDHFNNMEFGYGQFDQGGTAAGQSWQVIPCCSQQRVYVNGAKAKATAPPPLEQWADCICQNSSEIVLTSSGSALTDFASTVFHGQSSAEFEKVYHDALQQIDVGTTQYSNQHRFSKKFNLKA